MRAAVVGLVLLALLAAGCGGETTALPKGRQMAATWSINPPVALFGDPIVARVDVLLDRKRLSPRRVRVNPNFEPYERLGPPRRERRDLGRFTHLRYEFTIRCITLGCIQLIGGGPGPGVQPGGIPPPVTGSGGFGERKSINLKPAAISYERRDGKTRLLRRIYWQDVQSVSRLNFADTQTTGIGFPFRARVTPLPEATFRIAPPLLGAALLLGALLLLIFPALVFGRMLRRKPPPPELEEPELTPLERALALVEWARDQQDGEDRRKALEVLAEELEVEERPELADETRAVAWSPRSPSPEDADRVVASVKETSVREDDGSSV
jgi:hypothetical protein